jgi:hypothetical protein
MLLSDQRRTARNLIGAREIEGKEFVWLITTPPT